MHRRLPLLILAAITALGAISVSATRAGAAGSVVRLPHASLSLGHAVAGPRAVAPISVGHIELVSLFGGVTTSSGSVTATSPDDTYVQAVVGGLQPVTVTITDTVPLVAGSVYGTGIAGDVAVDSSGSTCDSASPDSLAAAKIDQISYDGSGHVTTAAITVVCLGGASGVILTGTVAYDLTPSTPRQGYYTYESDGLLTGYGNDSFLTYLGTLAFAPLNQPIVGMAQTADGGGYWMVASDGGIFSFGDAKFYGSMGGAHLNKPIVGMAATPDGKGYWLVASDGGIFAFGDARFSGSMGGAHLNKPIVGMASNTSAGYWLVASDGGIFAFGGAHFYGSTGNITLNRPVVGMTPTPDGKGYWFVASDGGIFAYGNAAFHGSTGDMTLDQPIVGMATAPGGTGYWLVADDGGIFSFDAPYYGSLPDDGLAVTDVVGLST